MSLLDSTCVRPLLHKDQFRFGHLSIPPFLASSPKFLPFFPQITAIGLQLWDCSSVLIIQCCPISDHSIKINLVSKDAENSGDISRDMDTEICDVAPQHHTRLDTYLRSCLEEREKARGKSFFLFSCMINNIPIIIT